MAVNLLSVSEVSVLRSMTDVERPLYFRVIATARKLDIAEVEKAYTSLLDSAAKRDEQDKAKAERERKAKLLDTLRVDVEAFRLGSVAPNGDEHDILFLEELRERAEGFGGVITFAGLGEDSLPRFTVGGVAAPKVAAAPGTAVRGGGTGAGRPAADAPQPYVDADTGERVLGPVTMFLRNKVTAERLAAANLLKADGKLKASGSVIAALAVKAGILRDAPLPVEAAEAIEVAPGVVEASD